MHAISVTQLLGLLQARLPAERLTTHDGPPGARTRTHLDIHSRQVQSAFGRHRDNDVVQRRHQRILYLQNVKQRYDSRANVTSFCPHNSGTACSRNSQTLDGIT